MLEAPRPTNTREAIIFGVWSKGKLGPEAARAFLRHAYNVFYHDFANVDVKQGKFIWQVTYREALLSFRGAAMRYATKLKRLNATRKYTSRTSVAPEEAYSKYKQIINIQRNGTSSISPAFQQAINNAVEEANNAINLNHYQEHSYDRSGDR